jgi:hypothetical protein
MEQRPRIDHAGEVIRIIDRVLAEESVVLEGLKKALDQNGITEQEMIERFNAYRQGLKGERPEPPPITA